MKTKSVWYCTECGNKQIRWSGQCSACNAWNTMQEEIESPPRPRSTLTKERSAPVFLHEIKSSNEERLPTNMKELDRTLGGGIVPGSLILIGGDPGIGKSTIALQIASNLSAAGKKVLYISGEESLEQSALRAKRLGVNSEHILFLNETEVSEIIRHADACEPALLFIDSIQIVYKGELQSAPGTVSQVREAAASFLELAKSKKIATILIGHVTKSGDIAGPKVLEHLVDTVLYFEGDRQHNLRLLRVVKNRFGPTDEVAVFQMHSGGLGEVSNPSQFFIEDRPQGTIGSSVVATCEGSRPFLVEVQSLVTNTFFPSPSRRAAGIDSNRLALLIAVLEKKMRLQLFKCDVFASATGGLRLDEPACDLGIALSITSSFHNRPIDSGTLIIGEVGLSGEVRPVVRIESRIKEGINLGFRRVIIPKRNVKGLGELAKSIEIIGVDWVDEAIHAIMH